MAKKDTRGTEPLEQHWICEGCDGVHVGVDPPDECYCGHRYFENLADIQRETKGKLFH